jgi:hypothetical protein
MASQAQVIRENLRENRARDAERQIQAMNFGEAAPDQIANGIPSVSNDAKLAAHLQEIRDTSQEYAKLRTEEARQQWEAIAADNFRKTQSAATELKNQAAVETMNRTMRERQDGLRALSEWEAVANSIDPAKRETEYTVPLDKLRDIAVTQQRVVDTTGIDPLNFNPMDVPVQPRETPKRGNIKFDPVPFPDGKLYHVENLPDGNVELKLATGEVFTGDMNTVLGKIADSRVNTAIWAKQKVQEAVSAVRQPENLGQDLTPFGSLADDLAARQADALARQFGFSNKDEMMQWGEAVNQKIAKVEQFEEKELAAQFHATCPDFPDTPETAETVMQIINSNRWQPNLESLQAAHALAVRNGLYRPLTTEEIAIANGAAPQQQTRTAPPPMLKTGNPDLTSADPSPYEMSMSELRKMAIRQQLDSSGPGYR